MVKNPKIKKGIIVLPLSLKSYHYQLVLNPFHILSGLGIHPYKFPFINE